MVVMTGNRPPWPGVSGSMQTKQNIENPPVEVTRRLALDPELGDGNAWSVIDDPKNVACALEAWMHDAKPGDEVTIRLVEMTKFQFEALPEV